MRFMTMVKSKENSGWPPPALMQAIDELGQEATKAGVLVETGGLLPSDRGASLRLSADGDIAVTDGPFAETKEVVGGFAVYEVKDKAEAIEWCRRFIDLHRVHWQGWEGEIELRQIMDAPPR